VRNLSDVAVGASVWDIEQLWNRMYRWLYNNGMGGVVMAAISAIDTALYDIVGQKLGVPAYKLLGARSAGRCRSTPTAGPTASLPRLRPWPGAPRNSSPRVIPAASSTHSARPRSIGRWRHRSCAALVEAVRGAGGPERSRAPRDVGRAWGSSRGAGFTE
jgi:L-alanine-DL-glutamate epimerase-like enolase superfamily enzyme